MSATLPVLLASSPFPMQVRDDALLREVNHRASNSLQIVASILNLHARETASSEVRGELSAAASRVRAISLVHELLYKTNLTESLDVGAYLNQLVSDIEVSYGDPGNTAFKFETTNSAPTHLHPGSVVKLGIIVTELLTNSVKYAGRPATCRVALSATAKDLQVTVSDDGVGMKAVTKAHCGIGMKIVKYQLERLKGTLVANFGNPGAQFVINVPVGGVTEQF